MTNEPEEVDPEDLPLRPPPADRDKRRRRPKGAPKLLGRKVAGGRREPQLDDNSIGAQIRRIRESKNLSQRDLATESGVSQITIAAIERGARPTPRVHVLNKILAPLGCHAEIEFVIKRGARPPKKGSGKENAEET